MLFHSFTRLILHFTSKAVLADTLPYLGQTDSVSKQRYVIGVGRAKAVTRGLGLRWAFVKIVTGRMIDDGIDVGSACFVWSTPVFVDPEISTQADGAKSSRVPVLLPEDPYEAIRQAYLDGTDTKSEPFEDPIETEIPESSLTLTVRIAVRVPPTMSPGLSASKAKVASMSDSAFRKKFRSSYESSPSLSPPDLPLQKRYRWDESLAVGDKGPGMGVESRGSDDESHGLDDEGHSVESDGLGLEEEEEVVPESLAAAVGQGSGSVPEPERPERVSASRQLTLITWTDPKDDIVYIDVPAFPPPAPPAQTPPSPSGRLAHFPFL
ncbi:hypothetical protein Tco_1417675 [Tanacetum coccineum]